MPERWWKANRSSAGWNGRCVSALIRPGVGAVGDGTTPEEALADLREGLAALIAEVGAPKRDDARSP